MDIKKIGRPFVRRDNRRHLALLGALLLLCIIFFTAVGLRTLPGSDTIYKHEIICNNTDSLTQPLQQGEEIIQMLYVQGPLYGVRLLPHTGGRQLEGTLVVEVEEHFRTATLARTQVPLSSLQEGVPADFVFDTVLQGGEKGTWFALRLTSSPATPEDAVSFYKSDGMPDYYFDENLGTAHYTVLTGFTLTQRGQLVQEMLNVEYLVDVSGPFLLGAYCFFASLLTLAVLLIYSQLFILQAPLHQVFVTAALGLGLVFLVLIPPRAAPDEYAHISTAYHYANQILGTGHSDELGSLWMRTGDEMRLSNYDATSVGIYAWRDMAQNLFVQAPGGPGSQVNGHSVGIFPAQLAAPTLGIVLARLLGVGRVGLLLLGRLSNLVFYTLIVSRAIKRIPLGKSLLFAASLLPMGLQLAASFSYDTYVLAIAYYFLACCLDYRFHKTCMTPRKIALLAVLCLLLAPAKAVYLPMLSLLFLVRPEQYSSPRACRGIRAGILTGAAGLWLLFTFTSLMLAVVGTAAQATADVTRLPGASVAWQGDMQQGTPLLAPAVPTQPDESNHIPDYKGELKPNGDAVQLYDIGYIVRHIPATAKLMLRSLWEQPPLWIQGLVGGRLGESIAVDIEVSWALVAGLLGVLWLSSLCSEGDNRTLAAKHRLAFGGIVLLCAAATVLAALTWTPVNYLTIFGVQGRYLLPVLPVLLLALRGRSLRFTRPVYRQLAFAQVLLVIACQAQAFSAILRLPC